MTNCINKNHPDFKDLLDKTGMNELVLAAKVSLWQERNGMDEFPTLKELENPTSNASAMRELDSKVTSFLSAIGVKIEELGSGDFVAVSKILEGIIQVVNGKKAINTLPEEAAHFFVRFMGINSPLIQRMMSQIDSMQIYSDTLAEYSGNPEYQYSDGTVNLDKIKEEAVGKLIGRNIVEFYQNKKSGDVASTEGWFERLMNMIKVMINKALAKTGITSFETLIKATDGKYSINPFEESAQRILKGDIKGLDRSNIEGASNMYQLSPEAIVGSIENSQKRITLVNEKTDKATIHEYVQDLGTPQEKRFNTTATTIAQDATIQRNKFSNVDDSKWEKYRTQGTQVHNMFQDIVNNYINRTNSTMYTAIPTLIEKTIYDKLKKAIVSEIEGLKLKYPGSKFLTEVTVIDPKMKYKDLNGKTHVGVAGSIDLLIVHPDGEVSIYDYKTFAASKDIYDDHKFIEYSRQLTIYKKILLAGNKELGVLPVAGIKHIRLIPISISRNSDGVMLDAEVKGTHPISLESTGNPRLDNKITDLYERLDNLVAMKRYSDVAKESRRQANVSMLRRSIIKLMTEKNYNTVIDDALEELKNVDSILMQDNITDDELRDTSQIIESYQDVTNFIDESVITPEQSTKLNLLVGALARYKRILESRFEQAAVAIMKQKGITNYDKLQKPMGFWAKWLKSISLQNHPIIAALHELIKDALNKSEIEVEDLRGNIITQIDKLEEWAKAHNMSLQSAYDLLIDPKKVHLVNKFSTDFYELRNKAKEEGNVKWLQDNMELNREAYETYKAKFIESTNQAVYHPRADINEKIRAKRISNFESESLNFVTSKFLKIKESKLANFHSKEYSNIVNNKELLEFYNFFTEVTKKYAEWLPNFNYKDNFMPNVHKTLVEELVRMGPNTPKGVIDRLAKYVSIRPGEDRTVGMYNPLTGKVEHKVPVFFLENIKAEEKSHDLGKILQMYGEMAINFRDMSEVDSKANTLYVQLKNSKLKGAEARTTGRNTENDKGLDDYIGMFDAFRDMAIYGIQDKNATAITKIISSFNGYAAFNILGLSVFPAVAAVTGNVMNLSIQASRNKWYNSKDYGAALWEISGGRATSSRDKDIAYGLLELFKPQIDDRRAAKDRRMSSNFVVKHTTVEHFFAMLRKPDEIFQAANFLAMTRNYTMTSEGKIVLISSLLGKSDDFYSTTTQGSAERKAAEKELADKKLTIKSLRAQTTIEDGILKIDGKNITPEMMEEIHKFRQTVRQVAKVVIGNMDPHDMMMAKENAYYRSLLLFRNWLPRMVSERFDSMDYNRELDDFTWGRYATTWNFIRNHFVDESNKVKLSVLMGVENVAKMEYLKYLETEPDFVMTETQFIDLYKSNLRASYRGMLFTASFLILRGFLYMGGGGMPDPDDPDAELQTGEQKIFLRALNRATTECLMYVNPLEALAILKSPTATISPLVNLSSAVNQTFKQIIGDVTGNEAQQKRAHPLRSWLNMIPLSSVDKFYRIYNKTWDDYLNDVNQ